MLFSSPFSLWVEFKSLFLLRLHDQIPSTFLRSRFLPNCLHWTIPTATQPSRTVASKHSSPVQPVKGCSLSQGFMCLLDNTLLHTFQSGNCFFPPFPALQRKKKKKRKYTLDRLNSLNCKLFSVAFGIECVEFRCDSYVHFSHLKLKQDGKYLLAMFWNVD